MWFLVLFGAGLETLAWQGSSDILVGDVPLEPNETAFINASVGAMQFYNAGYFGQNAIVANVEAGHIWGGHKVFDRAGFFHYTENGLFLPFDGSTSSELTFFPSSPALFYQADLDPVDAPQLGEVDIHATAVGHVLAGTGFNDQGNLTFLGLGMAPFAELWSGAIATEFASDGTFSISRESVIAPYKAFFTGTVDTRPGERPDVINSSWGFTATSAQPSEFTLILDALAASNPTVASVFSAGNRGPDSGTVGEPGLGFNQIAVGALAAETDPDAVGVPAEFSSRGPMNFYNLMTGETVPEARAPVHLVAPGENMALAAYGGATGTNAGEEPFEGDDLYFLFTVSGTSFAAPMVAGGIGLLKDRARWEEPLRDDEAAFDTRVIRSVLMASAAATEGWDNAQTLNGEGVWVTTQALDYTAGAGMLDLETAYRVHGEGTTNLTGSTGGTVDLVGWDFGEVLLGGGNDYFFGETFLFETDLTISLNWFQHIGFDGELDELDFSTARFANLDLEIWLLEEGSFGTLIARSESLYNNTEFLRVTLEEPGDYGFRILFPEMIYDMSELDFNSEEYAVAWLAVPIPEPATVAVILGALALGVVGWRRRQGRQFNQPSLSFAELWRSRVERLSLRWGRASHAIADD